MQHQHVPHMHHIPAAEPVHSILAAWPDENHNGIEQTSTLDPTCRNQSHRRPLQAQNGQLPAGTAVQPQLLQQQGCAYEQQKEMVHQWLNMQRRSLQAQA
jgi:hypothetical protein